MRICSTILCSNRFRSLISSQLVTIPQGSPLASFTTSDMTLTGKTDPSFLNSIPLGLSLFQAFIWSKESGLRRL